MSKFRALLFLLCTTASLTWGGSKEGVRGIDVIVKRNPSGGTAYARTDGNGGFTVKLLEPGHYTVQVASKLKDSGLAAGAIIGLTTSVELQNPGSSPSPGTGPLPFRRSAVVIGPSTSGFKLQAFAVIDSDGNARLERSLRIDQPGVLSGSVTLEQTVLSTSQVTFTAVAGGPVPADRSFEIVAEGIDSYSYTVRVNDNFPVRVQASPAEGPGGREGSRPAIRLRVPNAAFEPGLHQGMVEVTVRPNDGSAPIVEQVGITLDIRRPGDIGILSDRRDYVLPPLPLATRDGSPRLTMMTLELTNPDSREQVLRMGYEKPGDESIFRFPQPTIRIPPGGTVRVPVEVNRDAFKAGGEERKCVTVTKTNTDGTTVSFTYYYLLPDPSPSDSTSTPKPQGLQVACRPSRLIPVIVRSPDALRVGVPAEFVVEARDDCGNPVEEFVVYLTPKNGGQSASKAVKTEGGTGFLILAPVGAGKAVLKGGTSGFLAPAALSEPVEDPGVIVEVEKSTGAGKLTGRVDLPLLTLPNPGVAVLYGVRHYDGGEAVSPGDRIRLAVDLPDTPRLEADPEAPLPKELGGIVVLANGEPLEIVSVSPEEVVAMMSVKGVAGVKVILGPKGSGRYSMAVTVQAADFIPRLVGVPLTGGGEAAVAIKNSVGEFVALTPETKAGPGDTIVLAATGLGLRDDRDGLPVAAADIKVRFGGKETRVSALYTTVIVKSRSNVKNNLLEVPPPDGPESHDPVSGAVPVTLELGGVLSPAITAFVQQASALSAVDFTTTTYPAAPNYFYDGVLQFGPLPRSEASGSTHAMTTEARFELGPDVRFDRTAWFTTDPTGANPPPSASNDTYTIKVPSVPAGTNPVFGAEYAISYRLTAIADPSCGGAAVVADPASDSGFYPEGTPVQLSIVPPKGTVFSYWLGAPAPGLLYMTDQQRVVAVCTVASTNITLNTNLGNRPGLGVWFSSASGNIGGANGIAAGPASAPTTLNVSQGYLDGAVFSAFTKTSAPSLVWNGPSGNVFYSLVANPANGVTYRASYTPACVVINPSVNPPAAGSININGTLYAQNGAPPACYLLGSALTLNAIPATGQCFLNWSPGSSTANPLSLTVTALAGRVANFGACSVPSVTVNTNPANIGVTVGLSGSGTALNTFTPPAFTAGPGAVTVTPTSIANSAGDTRRDFRNWSLNGVPNAAWTNASQPVTLANSGGLFTANFNTFYRLTVNVTGNCTVTPAAGFYASGSPLAANVTLPPGGRLISLALDFFQVGGGFSSPLFPNGGAFNMNAPAALTAVCANVTPIPVTCAIGSVQPPSGMTTWYTLDEATAPFKDIAPGVQTDANVAAFPAFTSSIPGKVGNGARFLPAANNSTAISYAEAANSSEGDFSGNALSVNAWVRVPNLTPTYGIDFSVGILDKVKYAGTPGGSPGIGYSFWLNQGILHFALYYGNNGVAFRSWQVPTPNNKVIVDAWTHVAATVDRTTNTLRMYVNGQLLATHDISAATGPFSNSGKLLIGWGPGLYPAAVDLDEIGIFDRVLTGQEIRSIFDSGAAGQCKPAAASVNLTVQTVPGGLPARILPNTAFGAAPVTQSVPANSTQTVETNSPVVRNGTGYTFQTWSNGSTASSTQVPVLASNLTVTAAFNVACYVLTLEPSPAAGGTATMNPPSPLGLPDNCYPPNSVVTLTSQPANGYGHNSFGGDVPGTSQLIATVSMNGPKNVKIFFDTIVNRNITITTTPVGLGFSVDGTPVPSGPTTRQWAPNSPHQLAAITPQQLGNTGAYYAFSRWDLQWGSQPVGTNSTQAAYTATAPSLAGTFTAVYSAACYLLNVNAVPATGGAVTLSPAAGVPGYPANCYANNTVVTLTAVPSPGNALTNWTGDGSSTAPSIQVTINGASKTVNANFGAPTNITLTVATNPTGLQARVGATGAYAPAPIVVQQPPGNGSNSNTFISVTSPQILNGTGYTFTNWSTGGSAPTTTIGPVSNFTATANFAVTCYVLAVTLSPASGGTVTKSPAAGVPGFTDCYAPGTSVIVTATPGAGFILSGFTGATSVSSNAATVLMSGPKTLGVNFGTPSNVTLTVNTSPAGLDARIGTGGAYAPAPVSSTVPANTPATVSVTDLLVRNGAGYRFTGWTGATPTSSATATAPVGAGNTAATANFTIACYVVTSVVTGSGQNILNPAAGNVSGFPANCYAPGTSLLINMSPGNEAGVVSGTIQTASGTQNASGFTTIAVNSPVTITTKFALKPNPVISVTPARLVSGTTYTSNVSFQNQFANAGSNLRITAITFTNPASVSVTTPMSSLVYGAFPATGSAGPLPIQYTIPASIASGANLFVSFTVSVQNALGDTFVSGPTWQLTKP